MNNTLNRIAVSNIADEETLKKHVNHGHLRNYNSGLHLSQISSVRGPSSTIYPSMAYQPPMLASSQPSDFQNTLRMTQISQISDVELKNDYDMQPIKQQYFSIPANIQVTNKSKKHTSSNSTLDENINKRTEAPSTQLVAQQPEENIDYQKHMLRQ